eukprot:TRINITY_DN399_c4_g1_i1.p1 TRINITY_DN399_c4_g1~~TRINITY_DN399_c4_g1_i1.p1  ORF type:complete len:128 (+),score=10.51 TRINITY_DN399_c4_g1_i1:122-505(+)
MGRGSPQKRKDSPHMGKEAHTRGKSGMPRDRSLGCWVTCWVANLLSNPFALVQHLKNLAKLILRVGSQVAKSFQWILLKIKKEKKIGIGFLRCMISFLIFFYNMYVFMSIFTFLVLLCSCALYGLHI